jgi:NAD+ synthase
MTSSAATPVPELCVNEGTMLRTAARRFSRDVLAIDCGAVASETAASLRAITSERLHRRGLVLGVSGGIDSSVCAVLAARAVGPTRVRALLMPERESSAASLTNGRLACHAAGIEYEIHDITPALEVLGCYRKRDAAIQRLLPAYRSGDRFKIAVAGDLTGSDRVSFFSLVVELSAERGRQQRVRMPADTYLAIVAATNLKQRVRKLLEYTRADELNYAVVGTPNRLEYDQGFFVRGGDGLADVKPIAHLYKTQVFALGRHFGLPASITEQIPSTDTYSLPQTQEEFYFGIPYAQMDLLLWAYSHAVPSGDAARVMEMTVDQVERVYRDIESKRRVARQLDSRALLIESHPEMEARP